MPGDEVTVSISVNGSQSTAGLYIALDDVNQASTISGEGLALVRGGLTHTSPKALRNGSSVFRFKWQAPNTPGAVRFDVSALAANGDGRSRGDVEVTGVFDYVYGCTPQTYFRDFDGDGFGRPNSELIACAGTPPLGYAVAGTDCDDLNREVFPGAEEFCNRRDDDCDGEIDENASKIDLYPDTDGDGYYSAAERSSGDSVLGCVPTRGYAGEGGDCQPDNASINPGVEEVCNLVDDDCDARIDERTRPQCGVGWCRRNSVSCSLDSCIPGQPATETCNFLDDDCDGEVDEGEICPSDEKCIAGLCRPASSLGGEGGPVTAPELGDGSLGEATEGTSSGGASSNNSSSPASGGDSEAPGATPGMIPGEDESSSRFTSNDEGGCAVSPHQGRSSTLWLSLLGFLFLVVRVPRQVFQIVSKP